MYCGNDPVNNVDPDAHSVWTIALGAAATILSIMAIFALPFTGAILSGIAIACTLTQLYFVIKRYNKDKKYARSDYDRRVLKEHLYVDVGLILASAIFTAFGLFWLRPALQALSAMGLGWGIGPLVTDIVLTIMNRRKRGVVWGW